ncbi:pantothenate kinase [Acinetobacter sp. NIPH 298]|uniref:pantothenate kinase n=1 Tax=Acinetobacter sp. NIPH 298 TaxID=1217692 RepID=UPI0002CFB26E|nr:pantothenate kinase [Acinetobacter sp. NIPH 298]ENW93570.1 type III pantothenate kinase [Acinetobacter sp. NIPH 298]
MKSLWLDIGNTRLKYWITEQDQVIEHAAELHLQSPADLLLGLIQHFRYQNLSRVGISSVLDTENNQRIQIILDILNIPIIFAQVHAEYAGLTCGYDDPSQLGIDRWLQVLAVAKPNESFCVIGCGTALTIDLVKDLQHLGGYILPNLYLQRDALIQNTKGIKIPDSAFDNLKPGHNTVDAVHHGILLGLISSIEQIMQQSPKNLILTGGDAHLFAKFLNHYQPQVESDLLLKGLKTYVQLNSAFTKV